MIYRLNENKILSSTFVDKTSEKQRWRVKGDDGERESNRWLWDRNEYKRTGWGVDGEIIIE